MANRGRGLRGRGQPRGAAASSGAGVIRLPPRPTPHLDEPLRALPMIAPLSQPNTRRSSRTIQASRNVDPDLVESMRPGHVNHHPEADNSTQDDDEENTHLDNARERGDDDQDDSDYIQGRASASTQARLATHVSQAASPAGTTSTSRFSASERTPSRASAVGIAPSGNSSTSLSRSYIPDIPAEILTLLRTPTLIETLARHQASPSSAVSYENSASTAVTTASTSTVSSARTSPTPSIPSKRISTSGVELVDKQEEARAKKARHNAARPRHYQYRSDAPLSDTLKSSALLVQVHLATIDPFPTAIERKNMVKQQFNQAAEFHKLAVDGFSLGKEELKLLCDEETSMRGRIKRATTPLIHKFGFIRVPRSDTDIATNVALRHKLLGSTITDPYVREPLFHYKNIDLKDGRFLNPVITDVINDAFFGHAGALGCLYQTHFTPFPHPTLALVLTALEHGIEQYTSGKLDAAMRFSKDYKERYMAHLKSLQQYEHEPLWKRYRKKIVRDGLAYAGAQVAMPIAVHTGEGEVTQEEIKADMDRLAMEELDGFVDSSDIEPDPVDEQA